ncbi:MAG: hypothetical protein KJ634_11850 [Gammaproteobacteria bacterium]|nr:hypothetical protein [Gammaproteobacteria bacterium]MBU1416309.1 hypothetical protein [Gammaproteobacteria bacterium]
MSGTSGGAHDFAVALIPSGAVKALDSHSMFAHGFAPAWAFVCSLIYGFVDSQAKKKKVGTDNLLYLHRLLETIVEAKAHRLGDFLKGLRNGGETVKALYDKAMQPEQQIVLHANGIHSFFSHLFPDVGIRVGIAILEDNIPKEWLYWVPENKPPRSPIASLHKENSTLMTCVARRTMIVIENTQAEVMKGGSANFVHTSEGEKSAECSLICYPVIDGYTQQIPYVLNIAADKKGIFLEKNRSLYEWMLGHFMLRICLEHNLSAIYKHAEG